MFIILEANSCQEESNNLHLVVKQQFSHAKIDFSGFSLAMQAKETTQTAENKGNSWSALLPFLPGLQAPQKLEEKGIIPIGEFDVDGIIVTEMIF